MIHKHLLRIGASLGMVATFAGCASTQYSQYSGSPVTVGQGGANRNINGIDFWIYGTPNRPYQIIIGYIQDIGWADPWPWLVEKEALRSRRERKELMASSSSLTIKS